MAVLLRLTLSVVVTLFAVSVQQVNSGACIFPFLRPTNCATTDQSCKCTGCNSGYKLVQQRDSSPICIPSSCKLVDNCANYGTVLLSGCPPCSSCVDGYYQDLRNPGPCLPCAVLGCRVCNYQNDYCQLCYPGWEPEVVNQRTVCKPGTGVCKNGFDPAYDAAGVFRGCYLVVQDTGLEDSEENGEQYCAARNSHRVAIESAEEQQALEALFARKASQENFIFQDTYYDISLKRISSTLPCDQSWAWVYPDIPGSTANVQHAMTYTHWEPYSVKKQPNCAYEAVGIYLTSDLTDKYQGVWRSIAYVGPLVTICEQYL